MNTNRDRQPSQFITIFESQRQHRPHWPLVSCFAIFRTYKLSSFLKDLTAGFVLTAVLVPAGKGYAQASGLPPIYGLYATVVPLLAYAIFGPSRILVLSPDSSLAAFIAATILPLAAGNAERTLVLAGMLAILSSVIC